MPCKTYLRNGFAIALGFALVAVPALADEHVPDPRTVLAEVNGTEITLGHVILARSALPPQFQQLPDDMLFAPLLDQLIEQTLLMQAKENDLNFRDTLQLENDVRAFIADAALTEAALTAVTDEAVEAAYQAGYGNAEPGVEFNAAHILVETEEEAQALLAELEGGADFGDLARAHSLDGAGPGGGELGWFEPEMMVEPFADAVIAMEPGTFTGPIQTQFGWHLVLLNETRQAEVPTLEEVREQIVSQLHREAAQARIVELRAGADIIQTMEEIDPSVLSNPELVQD